MKDAAAFPTNCVWYAQKPSHKDVSRTLCRNVPLLILTNCSAICLEEFLENDQVRDIICKHPFHLRCIDEWVSIGHELCPLCNGNMCGVGVVVDETALVLDR